MEFPQFIRFKYDTKKLKLKEPVIRIYPLVCMHIGAAQADLQFIEDQIATIKKDPNARWVYMGDGGECVTKQSKGDVYAQLLSPQQQQDVITELLEPIKDKGLFGVRGNHGNRIYKETGLDFDKNLCHRLGVPYLGVQTFCNLIVNRSSYDLFFHHGLDSGVSIQTKVSKAEQFGFFIDADAIFTAHSHVCLDLPPAGMYHTDNGARKVVTKLRHQYICGSAYDSRSGYAADKGYRMLLPAWANVAFDGRIIQGKAQYSQKFSKVQSDGTRKLKHGYIFRD